MTTRPAKLSAGDEVATIEELIGDLEKRLHRIMEQTRGKASEETGRAGDFIGEALDRLMDKVREAAGGVSQTIASETTRVSGNAMKTLSEEIEHRPLLMLGMAAGIGFFLGLASRR